MLFLAMDEFLRAVDSAQLEHVVAHRRLHQHREVSSRRHRQHDFANAHAENLLGARLERQALEARNDAADRLLKLDDQLQILAHAHRGLPEDGADVEHPQPAHFEKVLEQLGAATLQRFGRDVIELDHVVCHQPAAARDQLERKLALAYAALADQQNTHAEHIEEYAVSRDELRKRAAEVGAHDPDDLQTG